MCSSTHMCMHGLRWMHNQRCLHQKAGKLSSSTYNRVHRHVVCRCEEHVRRGRHLQASKVKLSGQKHAWQHFDIIESIKMRWWKAGTLQFSKKNSCRNKLIEKFHQSGQQRVLPKFLIETDSLPKNIGRPSIGPNNRVAFHCYLSMHLCVVYMWTLELQCTI